MKISKDTVLVPGTHFICCVRYRILLVGFIFKYDGFKRMMGKIHFVGILYYQTLLFKK